MDFKERYDNPYGDPDHPSRFMPVFDQATNYGHASEEQMPNPYDMMDGFHGYMPATAPTETGHEQFGVTAQDYQSGAYGDGGGRAMANPDGQGAPGAQGGPKPVKTAPGYMKGAPSYSAKQGAMSPAGAMAGPQMPGQGAAQMGQTVSGMYGQGAGDDEILNRIRMMQSMGGQ